MAASFETTPDQSKCQRPFTSTWVFSSASDGRAWLFAAAVVCTQVPGQRRLQHAIMSKWTHIVARVTVNAALWILNDHPKERGRIAASALDI